MPGTLPSRLIWRAPPDPMRSRTSTSRTISLIVFPFDITNRGVFILKINQHGDYKICHLAILKVNLNYDE
jgi:hypothetical protein